MRYSDSLIAKLDRRTVHWGELLKLPAAPAVEVAPVVRRVVELAIGSTPLVLVTPRVRT